ncbi:MAG: sensor domain-containing diguanylate cyclase [candidate division Zixibacteria bacterium]|nr:sensor domain-containing diguanylate cyclase [candidate division Zixibacteria bacterium]
MTFSGKSENIYFATKGVIITLMMVFLFLQTNTHSETSIIIKSSLVYLVLNLILYWIMTKKQVRWQNIIFALSFWDGLFIFFIMKFGGDSDSQLFVALYFLIALTSIYLPTWKVILTASFFSACLIAGDNIAAGNNSILNISARTAYIWLTAGIGSILSYSMNLSQKKLLKTLDTLNERTWELESSQSMLKNLYETTRALSSILDFEQLLKEILIIAEDLLNVNRCTVLLSKINRDNLFVYAELNNTKKSFYDPPIPISDFRSADIEKSSFKSSQIQTGVFYVNEAQMLELPLISHGKVIGLIQLQSMNKDGFTGKERKNFNVFANATAVAIDNAWLHREMQELIIIDELTGLYNYRYFRNKLSEEIRRADRYHQNLSLLMVDCDHFKKINDSQGHETGNVILKEITDIIRYSVRDVDIVARYGGEEFMVILPQTDVESTLVIAERIRVQIEESYFTNSQGQRDLRITVSIGAAIFPDGLKSSSELLKKVDKALYIAKNNGRNQVSTVPPAKMGKTRKIMQ